jgi:D-3-phosphoglycerate dehydrogenase
VARVLVADRIADSGIELLRQSHEVEVRTGLAEAELAEALVGVAALVVRSQTQVTRAALAKANDLRVIARAGVGIDNIDLDAATERGIIVVNAPLANTVSAAEHAFGLMLAVARHIPQGDASLRGGAWERIRFLGVELAGRTLGIVGLGRIGSEVARRARAFEMDLLGYDPFVAAERARSLGVELVDLGELFARSDFVTLHTALLDETRGLVNAELLAKAKPGLRLINAARGALIDEPALLAAVESGQLAGAGIDVFSSEPAVGNVLTTDPRIVVTPHLGASTAEAQDRAALSVVEQVIEVLAGGAARFAVNAPLVDPETMAVIGPYLDAARLAASVAVQLAPGGLRRARIEYRGEVGTRDVAPLRTAAIVGLLAHVTEETVTLVNAAQLAQAHGLEVDEERGPATEPFANLITVRVYSEGGEASVAATHTGDGVRIVGIDDYDVELSPRQAPYLLAIENIDRPGAVGQVGTQLGALAVNISSMSVAAGAQEHALMMLGVTRALTAEELKHVEALDNVSSVRQVEL